ncbi:interferon phi 2 [Takifugu flavidus]|uniref:Uncharacterized protein n=1 Tax=Takifugu flavidus TaxID=433684 RepID=A0A5C6MH49_9TELE|nr:interferon phi 2 [Takifugu flavidus]XP_056879306.1 interferon phi 2 [Takifugu flavidus]TWW54456.1 hypothetical protein D4764_0091930 [Takifugu flavidus]
MKTIAVILSLLQVWLVVAMPTCRLEGHLVQLAHDLLQNLGENISVHCLPYNANMSFPESVLTGANKSSLQCHKALWVVSESLRGAAQIMEDSIPFREGGEPWNKNTFSDFQNLQYQILDQGQCLTYKDTTGVLASYFTNMTTIIQQEDIAFCGWMFLRRDLLRVLKSTLQKHDTCFTWRD